MPIDIKSIAAQIKSHLNQFDKKGTAILCNELIQALYQSEEQIAVSDAEQVLKYLRNKRMFSLMQQVADALLQTGRESYTIRRQYAQALIDQSNYTAALAILNELAKDTAGKAEQDSKAKKENKEALGLIGRVYKQLYVNADSPGTARSRYFITQAIQSYLSVYIASPEAGLWHGINAVALLQRAKRDAIDITAFPEPEKLATAILATIQNKYEQEQADAWDFATAAEACIALERPEEALEWLSGYARMPYCDAFELASTLRQLKEVWRLDMDTKICRLLLPILQAELLKREGANVLITADTLQGQKALEQTIDAEYQKLKKPVKDSTDKDGSPALEKVFGEDSFKTYRWYTTGVDRCMAVARIGRDATKGFGTGFLLKGNALHDSLSDELVLLTNAHVVSNNPLDRALAPEEATVIFEAIDKGVAEFKVAEIIWSSPSTELDATVLRFDTATLEKVKELTKNIALYPMAKTLPLVNPDGTSDQRVYIIGYPLGGTLQLSFQDNMLLDYQDPRIHYRTPTVGGSSGSPVFNQLWDLIGLHHAGSATMRKLNNKEGTYEANEGIWLQSIQNAITLPVA